MTPLIDTFMGSSQRVNFFNDMVAEEKQIAQPAYVSPEEYLVRERAAFEKSEYLETDRAASFRIDTIDLSISLETVYARTTGVLV